MLKFCHGRLSEDIFHAPYLSCGLILYRNIFMLDDSRQTQTKRNRSSPSDMLLQKRVMKICSKFTEYHPRGNAISIKLLVIIDVFVHLLGTIS